MRDFDQATEQFFSSKAYGVVGASSDRNKYGNKVLRVYQQNHKIVYPINPHVTIIEGLAALSSVDDLPDDVKSISVITPPAITEEIVRQAHKKGIKNIWMQPGAESDDAISYCEANGINVIAGGPCLLVFLGFHEEALN